MSALSLALLLIPFDQGSNNLLSGHIGTGSTASAVLRGIHPFKCLRGARVAAPAVAQSTLPRAGAQKHTLENTDALVAVRALVIAPVSNEVRLDPKLMNDESAVDHCG